MVRRLSRAPSRGFTLIEVIVVIVILGIVAAISTQFIIKAVEEYRAGELTNKLIQRGRLSIEQITREIHMALPNAIRISATGNCLELLPVVATTSYQYDVPDQNNSIAAITSIDTSSFRLGRGTPKYVIIAPFSDSEVYLNPSYVKATLAPLGLEPYDELPLSSSHTFLRNSVNKRAFIVDDPIRYCISQQNLVRYSAYGFLTSFLDDSNPGGISDLVSHQVSPASGEPAFILSSGSQDMNLAVYVHLTFANENLSINLNHQVLIRNVP